MKIEIGRKYVTTKELDSVNIYGAIYDNLPELFYPIGSVVEVTKYQAQYSRPIVTVKFPNNYEWDFDVDKFRRWFKEVE